MGAEPRRHLVEVHRPLLRRGASPPQRPAGQHPRVLAAVDDDLAIDDHVVDPDRELLWLRPRRRRLDRLGVEHDDVGLEAVPQQAAVG